MFEKNYTLKAGYEFERFVITCLKQEMELFDYSFNESKINNYKCDLFLPNGLRSYTNLPTLVEIKYTSRVEIIRRFIEKFNISRVSGYKLLVISLLSETNCEFLNDRYKGVIFLGESFINRLKDRHQIEWWEFVSSCSSDSKIDLDNDGKLSVEIKEISTIDKIKGLRAELNSDKIHELNDLSEKYFFRDKNNSSKKISLFIGNGVSIPFGSSLWSKLSDDLFEYLSPKYIDNVDKVKQAIGNTNFANTSISKLNIPPVKYRRAVKEAIYKKYETSMHTPNTIIRKIVDAKYKNKNLKLFTYNYDNFIENDYRIKYSTKMDRLTIDDQIGFRYEPYIVHLHGIVERLSSRHFDPILTSEEYFDAYKPGKWVYEIQYKTFKEDTCLFIGSSMSDLFQMSVINDVKSTVDRKFGSSKVSWWCYAILCFKDMTPKDIATVYLYYYKQGVRVIFVNDFNEIPKKVEYLLS